METLETNNKFLGISNLVTINPEVEIENICNYVRYLIKPEYQFFVIDYFSLNPKH